MRNIVFSLFALVLLSQSAFAGKLIIVNPQTKSEVSIDCDPNNFTSIEAVGLQYSHAITLGFLPYSRTNNGTEARIATFNPAIITVMRTPEDGRPFVASTKWAESIGAK